MACRMVMHSTLSGLFRIASLVVLLFATGCSKDCEPHQEDDPALVYDTSFTKYFGEEPAELRFRDSLGRSFVFRSEFDTTYHELIDFDFCRKIGFFDAETFRPLRRRLVPITHRRSYGCDIPVIVDAAPASMHCSLVLSWYIDHPYEAGANQEYWLLKTDYLTYLPNLNAGTAGRAYTFSYSNAVKNGADFVSPFSVLNDSCVLGPSAFPSSDLARIRRIGDTTISGILYPRVSELVCVLSQQANELRSLLCSEHKGLVRLVFADGLVLLREF